MLRGLLKSVSMECGALSVMTAGARRKQQWCANSLVSREQVSCDNTTTGS